MKTKNQFRPSKMIEIERIWERYKYLDPAERLFMVLEELSKKAIINHDHAELPSHNELAKIFDGIFVNPKTGQPTYVPAIVWIKRLLSYIRKDQGHPHIRPYTEMHVEELADGTEVVRNYVNFLRGKKAVLFVNNRIDQQQMGLDEIKKQNNDLVDVRVVNKEIDLYKIQLELKNRDAKKRKRF